MVRKLSIVGLILSTFLLLPAATADAQDRSCPEDSVCITQGRFDQFMKAARHQVCMRDALENDEIEVSAEPFRLIEDAEGRIYTDGEATLHIKWCDYEIDLVHHPEVEVHRQPQAEESTWGFRLRIRLGMAARLLDADFENPLEMFDPAILVEPFHVHDFHLLAHLATGSFGVGVGVDLPSNLDAFGAVGVRWTDPSSITPIVGLSLSFN